MKATIRNLLAAMLLVAASLQIHAQGVIDQESDTSPIAPVGNEGADGLIIQTVPLTQSFIPSQSAIDFVALEFEDISGNGTAGTTIDVDLYNSVSPFPLVRNLIGSTTPVSLPSNFVNDGLGVAGVAYFYFSAPIALTPGQTYYLEPVVLSGGGPLDIVSLTYNAYANGQLFGEGNPAVPTSDLWFREGVVSAPEPTTLALVGMAALLFLTRKRYRNFLLLPNCLPYRYQGSG